MTTTTRTITHADAQRAVTGDAPYLERNANYALGLILSAGRALESSAGSTPYALENLRAAARDLDRLARMVGDLADDLETTYRSTDRTRATITRAVEAPGATTA